MHLGVLHQTNKTIIMQTIITIVVLSPLALALGAFVVRQVRLHLLDTRLFSDRLIIELQSFDYD